MSAQTATVRVEENVRTEPNGVILGRVSVGSVMPLRSRSGEWAEVEMSGWMWARSLQVTDRGGFNLVISADAGENLRDEPQGSVLARLERGTLLEERERVPGWIRVRRSAWIWGESLEVREAPGEPSGATQDAEEEPVPPTSALRVPAGGLPILSAPDGDTLARARQGTDVLVIGREGGWARVRMEGWVWSAGEAASSGGADRVADVSPADVIREPDGYRGRLVTWRLQFISLERAEAVRTDFYEGEPFLLTRTAEGQGSFVYVAVARERLAEVRGLTPLERVDVVGRVRVGASAVTGSPVLDLVEMHRVGG